MHEFLIKHPTPWRLEERDYNQDGQGTPGDDLIVDANNNVIIQSADTYDYESALTGDVKGLISFINSIGEQG